MQRVLLFIITLFALQNIKAEVATSAFLIPNNESEKILVESILLVADSIPAEELTKKQIVGKKLTAIGLALTLGPLGMHRLYLGTDFRVPIFYSVTLGAFGVLPVLDIVAIIITKDYHHLENNNKMIMWLK